jgi:general secretion pathway protein E
MEPFTVAAALRMIVAQRLVRRFCHSCTTTGPVSDALRKELEEAGLTPPAAVRTAPGCAACGGTGYSGRTGVFEVLRADDAIRDAISRRAPLSEIRKLATDAGMRSLRQRGLQLVLAGVTSLDEIHRHTLAQ